MDPPKICQSRKMLLFSVLLLTRCLALEQQQPIELAPLAPPPFPGLYSDIVEQLQESAYIQLREPFPTWLRDLTGLHDWPSEDPPYIPLSYIDLSVIPSHIPRRSLGDCRNVERTHCSFDCYRCVSSEDVVTCPVLTQTFDDGPSPSTPKLLDQLQGRTTFFSQGINVIRFPETFRQQHAQGHLMGTHTWSHANLPGLSNQEIIAQIQWSIWAMNATAGIIPIYFRPPYGALDDRVRAITRQFNLIPVFWDRDTFDWRVNDNSKTEAEVYQDVQLWRAESSGGLILEHDSTIKTVNVGIEISKILGYRQLTVAECINGPWYQNQ
jgi:chitin deacetylase